MNKRKRIMMMVVVGITLLLNVLILNYKSEFHEDTKKLYFHVASDQDVTLQLYYGDEYEFQEEFAQMLHFDTKVSGGEGTFVVELPVAAKNVILCSNASEETRVDVYYNYYYMQVSLLDKCESSMDTDGATTFLLKDGVLKSSLIETQYSFQKKMNIVFCVVLDLVMLFLAKYMFQLLRLAKEICENRVMIIRLGKNDFKTKFAGSYLGIIWAFIQPVVTILVYWFVFQVGFRSSPVDNFPFVLWLTAGMVPWFFFSEGWMAGTNSLLDYSYLVKKVVFNISTIPIVKVMSAMFVHIFFASFMLFIYICYGYMPDLYWLQIVYYSFCLLMLVIALSYLCSAIMVFFRDLSQIINVFLQVGIWFSCIMWSVDMLPERFRWIMYFNPIYYVVSGYRNALVTKQWFWQTPYQTMGFWIFIVVLMSVGVNVFNKLRVHFADVL